MRQDQTGYPCVPRRSVVFPGNFLKVRPPPAMSASWDDADTICSLRAFLRLTEAVILVATLGSTEIVQFRLRRCKYKARIGLDEVRTVEPVTGEKHNQHIFRSSGTGGFPGCVQQAPRRDLTVNQLSGASGQECPPYRYFQRVSEIASNDLRPHRSNGTGAGYDRSKTHSICLVSHYSRGLH